MVGCAAIRSYYPLIAVMGVAKWHFRFPRRLVVVVAEVRVDVCVESGKGVWRIGGR